MWLKLADKCKEIDGLQCENLISKETLGVHMLNLFYDKNEHMHTQGIHCEIKLSQNCPKLIKLLSYAPLKTEWLLFQSFKKFEISPKKYYKFGQVGQ